MKNIVDYARERYATKLYNSDNKKLSQEQITEIKELLQLSPSSVNSQPWHFIIASTDEGKQKIAKSTEGPFSTNKEKVLNSGLTVVFCAKKDLDENYLQHITDKEREDGRFGGSKEAEEGGHKVLSTFVDIAKQRDGLLTWTSCQTYLNGGAFLLGVAAMGLDATPMEGFDRDIIEKEFGLEGKGLKSLFLVTVGHHSDEDRNLKAPKSRLDQKETMTEI